MQNKNIALLEQLSYKDITALLLNGYHSSSLAPLIIDSIRPISAQLCEAFINLKNENQILFQAALQDTLKACIPREANYMLVEYLRLAILLEIPYDYLLLDSIPSKQFLYNEVLNNHAQTSQLIGAIASLSPWSPVCDLFVELLFTTKIPAASLIQLVKALSSCNPTLPDTYRQGFLGNDEVDFQSYGPDAIFSSFMLRTDLPNLLRKLGSVDLDNVRILLKYICNSDNAPAKLNVIYSNDKSIKNVVIKSRDQTNVFPDTSLADLLHIPIYDTYIEFLSLIHNENYNNFNRSGSFSEIFD